MDKMIVYEDDSLIVVHKPAGIATQTAKLGQADLVSELKNYRNNKGENPYIGVIHRLDQPVEGLLVFAKNPDSAKKLSAQLNNSILNKKYAALVEGKLDENAGGELTDYLLKDGRTNSSKVVPPQTKDSKEARLTWKMIKSFESYSLVEVELFTGRHHQIRVQMSHANMPLLGDMKYGSETSKKLSKEKGIGNTALLANEISFEHPVSRKKLKFNIPYSSKWNIN